MLKKIERLSRGRAIEYYTDGTIRLVETAIDGYENIAAEGKYYSKLNVLAFETRTAEDVVRIAQFFQPELLQIGKVPADIENCG